MYWLAENIFWNYRKLGFFVRSNCYPLCHRSSLNCLLCQYSLSKRTTFVCALPPRDALSAHAGIVQGLYAALNPFGTCLEFLLNIRAGHSTTVCVLQQPYNQQSPCSATPLWKQRFDIGSTI